MRTSITAAASPSSKRGFLNDDATIVTTRPTIALAQLIREDSFKIHQRESQRLGRTQQFTRTYVEAVFDRFEPVDYGGGCVEALSDAPDKELLVFQFRNAAHLLGLGWLMLQTGGYSVVFSGDLGNRVTHLPSLQSPPEADLLFLESTYGGTHSHTSMGDARSDLFDAVRDAVENGEPVLIPTLTVGRAQLLQLLFKKRFMVAADYFPDRAQLVVDGMAQEATEIYHQYTTADTYMDESIVNRVTDSEWDEPFRPTGTVFPQSDAKRREVLQDVNPLHGGDRSDHHLAVGDADRRKFLAVSRRVRRSVRLREGVPH